MKRPDAAIASLRTATDARGYPSMIHPYDAALLDAYIAQLEADARASVQVDQPAQRRGCCQTMEDQPHRIHCDKGPWHPADGATDLGTFPFGEKGNAFGAIDTGYHPQRTHGRAVYVSTPSGREDNLWRWYGKGGEPMLYGIDWAAGRDWTFRLVPFPGKEPRGPLYPFARR